MAQSQAEESSNQKAFEEVKAAKEEEIRAGQEQLEAKTQQLADTNEKNAQSKQDLGGHEEFLNRRRAITFDAE